MKGSLPCYLEDPKKSSTPKDGDSQRWHELGRGEDDLQDAADDHEAVEPVKHVVKVAANPEAKHLDQHFHGEEHHKDNVCVS